MRISNIEKAALAVIAVAALRLLLGGLTLSLGGKTLTLGALDAGATGAVLGPVMAAWAASKHRAFRDSNGDGIPDDEQQPTAKV